MKPIIILTLLTCAACSEKEPLCTRPIQANDSRPDILVIGGSISYGYYPTIKNTLTNYDVIHNPCNSQDTTHALSQIDYWLSLRPQWSAITFNSGAWDVSFRRGVTGPEYEHNLRIEALKIKQATPNALFVLTASVPIHDSTRSVGSEIAYNNIAIRIMNELSIPYVDNYTLSLSIPDLRRNANLQNDVHWTEEGSILFGQNILLSLNTLFNIN